MNSLPAWITTEGWRPSGPPPRYRREWRILRRSLLELALTLSRILGEGERAREARGLRRVDARAKLLAAGCLLLTGILLRSPASLGVLALLSLAAFPLSGGAWREAWKPLALAAGTSLLLLAPAALNIVSGGEPAWVLFRTGAALPGPWRLPEAIAVTDAGMYVALRTFLRTMACTSLGLLLTLSTPPAELLRALRVVGIPSAFVMVFEMAVRYIALLVRSAQEIHLAKLSRSAVPQGSGGSRRWTAAGMGELYRRSLSLAEGVALAMASRGYDGEVRLLSPPRWRLRDSLAPCFATAVCAGLFCWDSGLP